MKDGNETESLKPLYREHLHKKCVACNGQGQTRNWMMEFEDCEECDGNGFEDIRSA